MADCKRCGVKIQKKLPKKLASPFPESNCKISTLFFIFRGLEQSLKPTRTQPYLTASSLIHNTLQNRRDRAKLYPCLSFFESSSDFAPSKVLGKLQLLLGKHYLVQPASKSCCRQQMGFHKGDQQLFQHTLQESYLPSAGSQAVSHPHRNVKVVRLQWQAKKNKEVCTWFDCHCSAVKICDCSAKHNYDFFVRWGREFCASPGTGLLLQEGAPARITVRHHEGARVLAEVERDCSPARGEPAGACAKLRLTRRQRCLGGA